MYAIYTMRKLALTSRINQLNAKLMEISQQQMDLASYSANISDGYITPEEAANSPASLFQRQSAFMGVSSQNAAFSASNATNAYMAQYNALNTSTNGAYANAIDPSGTTSGVDQTSLYNSYYKSALEAAAKTEQKRIEAMENEIDQQRLKIETQLEAATKELDSVKEAETSAIDKSTPKYTV